jgi:hypothetical protein
MRMKRSLPPWIGLRSRRGWRPLVLPDRAAAAAAKFGRRQVGAATRLTAEPVQRRSFVERTDRCDLSHPDPWLDRSQLAHDASSPLDTHVRERER